VPAAESRSEAALHGRIGLRTMRTQIESVGGAFHFESAPGAGTRVSGWVPAATQPQSPV
jgi:signal transduction histidine kinase